MKTSIVLLVMVMELSFFFFPRVSFLQLCLFSRTERLRLSW